LEEEEEEEEEEEKRKKRKRRSLASGEVGVKSFSMLLGEYHGW
jgi:hypothetical protein